MTAQPKRGGAREGAGRKTLPNDQRMIVTPIRLTEAQREKLTALGGAAWIREKIEKAKISVTSPQ